MLTYMYTYSNTYNSRITIFCNIIFSKIITDMETNSIFNMFLLNKLFSSIKYLSKKWMK